MLDASVSPFARSYERSRLWSALTHFSYRDFPRSFAGKMFGCKSPSSNLALGGKRHLRVGIWGGVGGVSGGVGACKFLQAPLSPPQAKPVGFHVKGKTCLIKTYRFF